MSAEKSHSLILVLLTAIILIEGGCIFWLFKEVTMMKSCMDLEASIQEISTKVSTEICNKKEQLIGTDNFKTVGSSKVKRKSPCQCVDGTPGTNGSKGDPGMKGEQGPQGVTGSPGEKGPQGLTGSPGEQGSQGVTGPPGEQGAQGVMGSPGEQGAQGVTGPPGEQHRIKFQVSYGMKSI